MSRFVPYLADEAIERDAASLIGEYERARGVTIEPPIPVLTATAATRLLLLDALLAEALAPSDDRELEAAE